MKLREGMSSPRGKYKVQNAKAKDSTSSQSTEEASLKEKNMRWEKNSFKSQRRENVKKVDLINGDKCRRMV